MRRVSAVLLGTMLVVMVACGPSQPPLAAKSETESGSTTTETGDPSDSSDGDGDGDGVGDGDGEPSESGDGDGAPPPDLPGQYCAFEDPYLEQQVALKLGLDSGPVPTDLAQTLTTLSIFSSGVEPGEYPTSLVGIDCAANLASLRLPPGTIDDLSPLARLHELNRLYITGNELTELDPLAQLPALEHLYLRGNPIADGELTDIAALPLQSLSVAYTQITGHDEILLFDELRSLDVSGLPLSDLSPLADTHIVRLWIDETEVVDLSPLTSWGPDGLACLGIGSAPVTDLSPLLEVDWVPDLSVCTTTCAWVDVDTDNLDAYSNDVVIPTLCDMGISVNNCLFCPQ